MSSLLKKFPAKAWLPTCIAVLSMSAFANADAGQNDLHQTIEKEAGKLEQKVIAWRRDIHANPELSNREFRTAKLVADHLKKLGFDEVRTGVSNTGVVGILKGGKPGGSVALRADMDALPVAEVTGLPFASTVKSTYNGKEVGVMHACGHDAHTAILMGVAELMVKIRDQIPGTVRFLFQPAEEGAPAGEESGAEVMVAEGALGGPDAPTAIFGLHVWPGPVGEVSYRAGGAMAGATEFTITVKGRQTHAAMPWRGIDPVTVSAQIILALQTIPSRQMDITQAPTLISIGNIHGGLRNNIIPDDVVLNGTIRILDPSMEKDFFDRVRHTAETIAEASGARAEMTIQRGTPVTFNDPALTRKMLPSLIAAAGEKNVKERLPVMGAEDFSVYQQNIPGLFVFLGVNKAGIGADEGIPNHSPKFYVNEDALEVGIKTLSTLAIDYLASKDNVADE